MVLTAPQALSLTNTSITVQDNLDLQDEVANTEKVIRNASGRGLFSISYNATILDNPPDDPHDDNNLTPLQIAYRDTFINAEYIVSLDSNSGYWKFTWENIGPEQTAYVYSIRTTVLPGSVSTMTENAIIQYFETLAPIVTVKANLIPQAGADIDETDFGAIPSTFYEYVAVTSQPDDTDHSAALRSHLTLSGLGYLTTNVNVYRIAS